MAVNIDTDGTIAKLLGPSQQRMQAFGASLNGAGAEAAAAYKSMTSMASGMVDVSKRAADTILTTRANEELPRDFRLTRTNETRDAARLMVTKLNDGAHQAAGQLEAALTTALLPVAAKDASQRLLIRDSIRTRYGRLDGERLLAAIQKRLGQHESHDAELLSSFGSDFLEGAGITADQVDGLRAQATQHYLSRADGRPQQQAARKALTTMRDLNIKGHLASYRTAAQFHLSKAD